MSVQSADIGAAERWFREALTDELEARAYDYFRRIDQDVWGS